MHRLLALAPKRQSQRLQVKQQQQRSETSENESTTKDATARGGPSNSIYVESDEDEYNGYSSANDGGTHVPLTEQERARRDEIAKQREYRLQQRLLKRESTHIEQQMQQVVSDSAANGDDTCNQASTTAHGGNEATNNNAASDFNIRNYFLMHKVLTKVLQSKYAWPFKTPVSEEDAPDYYKIIEVNIRVIIIVLFYRTSFDDTFVRMNRIR
jgi:hypothetical protein